MAAVFTALEPGWVNIYHDKEADKVYFEACPGVVAWEEQTTTRDLVVGRHSRIGYVSFSSKGNWNLAANGAHYVMTAFIGPGTNVSRKEYDEVIVPQCTGNLWELQ